MNQFQQCLLVKVRFSDDEFGTYEERELVYAIEDSLLNALQDETGECDGHEFGGGWGVVFCYGTNADQLFDVVIPHVLKHDLPADSYIVKRYGPPESPAVAVPLTQGSNSH